MDKLLNEYEKIVFFNHAQTVAIMDFTQKEFEELEEYFQQRYLQNLPYKIFTK